MDTTHRGQAAVILMYHRIADDGTDLCVSPAEFRDHLAFLDDAGYRVLPLRTLAAGLKSGALPERSVAITFDDGYLDALTHAAPVLQEFGFPATFFAISSTLDGPGEFWWETLERVFAHSDLPPSIDKALPDGVGEMPTRTRQERRAAFDAVRATFYPLPLEVRQARIHELLQWSGLPSSTNATHVRALSPDELRALSRLPGMEIGAHTENHLLLPAQPATTKEREIVLGKRRLEAVLEQEVATLSYPHGGFDQETVEFTAQAGFTVAVTTGNLAASAEHHSLVLPRLGIRSGDDLRLRLEALFSAEALAPRPSERA